MVFHVNCLLVDDSYKISRSIFSLKFKQNIAKVYSATCLDRGFKGYILDTQLNKVGSSSELIYFYKQQNIIRGNYDKQSVLLF